MTHILRNSFQDYKNKIIILPWLTNTLRVFIFQLLIIILSTMMPFPSCYAQSDTIAIPLDDYSLPAIDTNQVVNDTLLLDELLPVDSLLTDTLIEKKSPKKKKSESPLESKVIYNAKDSIVFDVINNVVYLYGEADVKYDKITLKADYIEYSFKDNLVFAEGRLDSAGQLVGKPEFIEGEQTFIAKKIEYNFETKKGLIKEVITKQMDGYLHAERTKKHPDERIHMKRGKYTTCDAEKPHFHLELSRAVVIPDDKIVTGPAFLRLFNLPLPLGIPFAYLPNKDTKTNGILIPTYGASPDLGFFLLDGGYYIPIGDKMDMQLRADIYSKGSWGLKNQTRYKSRYKYDGDFNVEFNNLRRGYKVLDNFDVQRTFFVRWNHSELPTVRPNSKFNASVNVGSSNNFRNSVASSQQDFLQSTFQSNIGYVQNFANKPFTLSLNLRHSQNTQSKMVSMTLPEVTFNVQRFDLPLGFLRRDKAGSKKWFERIGVNYIANMKNEISVADSMMSINDFGWLQDFSRNGVQQRVSATTSIKMLKYFTLTPSANATENWYFRIIDQQYDPTLGEFGELVRDTISKFDRTIQYSFNTGLTTKIYGMYTFKNAKVKAIRHVFTPNLSFNITPQQRRNQVRVLEYRDPTTGEWRETNFSPYELGAFGRPNGNQSGVLGMNLINNIEMKVRSFNKDGEPEDKKITLIENLGVTGGYDIFRDSLNFQTVNVNARTRLFENINLVHNSAFEPYAKDMETGLRVNRFQWDETGVPLQFERMNTALSFNMRSKNKTGRKSRGEDGQEEGALPKPEDEIEKTAEQERQERMIKANPDAYVDFNIPWNFNVNYNVSVIRNFDNVAKVDTFAVVQGITLVGDISINDKWKVTINTGYDIKALEFTTTQIGIYRDLHCWEASINWIPTGIRKSIMFQINVKAATLQDLKYTARRQYGGGQLLY
jgi:hypothetical protein